MTARLIAATAIVLAATAGSASGASGAAAIPRACGTTKATGKVWDVTATGVACARAKALVRSLAAKPLPPASHPFYPGLYQGMRCIGGVKSGERGLTCVAATGKKAVYARARR